MKSKILIVRIIIFISLTSSCDSHTDITEINLCELDSAKNRTKIIYGSIFNNKEYYLYTFNEKEFTHEVFKQNLNSFQFERIFYYEGGIGSNFAEFIDCNFDDKKDLLISIDSNGNFGNDLNVIFIFQNDNFIQIDENVSLPIIDSYNKCIISRLNSPNDTIMISKKYHWENLKLVRTVETN